MTPLTLSSLFWKNALCDARGGKMCMANHSHRHQRLHCPYHFSDVARLSSQDFRTLQRIWYHWRYVMAATIATRPPESSDDAQWQERELSRAGP